MKAEIVSIGTELLLGEITDTNASYLAAQLPLLGIDLYWVSQVGDNLGRMLEVLGRAWQRSDLILTTGGLGPTADDLTREAVTELLGEKMEVQPALEKWLRERFSRGGMVMPVSNLKQATLIPSAQSIPNELGTAPGWRVEKNGRMLIAMPGPPREMQEMWRKEILPRLQRGVEAIICSRTLKTVGLSEAGVGELVFPLFPDNTPSIGVYAKPDGIQIRLTAKAKNREEAERIIADGEVRVRAVLGDNIWGTDKDTLETAIGRLLLEKGLSLAVMEDYSGGWLTAPLTDNPDSPDFFKGGLVACSDEAKIALGVNAETIARYGAISPEVAQAMAQAAKTLLKADIGVGITGIGKTNNSPGEVVYIGICNGKNKPVINRPRGKQRVTAAALFELRKSLISLEKGN